MRDCLLLLLLNNFLEKMLKLFLILTLTPLILEAAKVPTFTGSLSGQKNYDGYKVLTVIITKNDLHLLEQLKSQIVIDTWKEPTPVFDDSQNERHLSKKPIQSSPSTMMYQTDIMMSPVDVNFVSKFFEAHHLRFEIKMEDVGSIIRKQNVQSRQYQEEKNQKKRAVQDAIDWNDYYPLENIYEWLDEVSAIHSDLASIQVIGQSGQGQDIKMVKISRPGSAPDKPAILIDGGIHAREWISPATVTYGLNDLLTNPDSQAILDKVDFYIVPVLNVDGYAYTFSTDRFWRKTLSDLNGTSCVGVDANRNFAFQFGGDGSSSSKCSEAYHGPYAFSEPETAALRDVMQDTTINWKAYITVHSYSQLWITPWGYTDELPEDHEEMMAAGKVGADALEAVHGTKFRVGPAPYAAGCSDDFAKGVVGIKYVHTLELRDQGQYGFVLPADQIVPSGEETWAGIRAFGAYVSER